MSWVAKATLSFSAMRQSAEEQNVFNWRQNQSLNMLKKNPNSKANKSFE